MNDRQPLLERQAEWQRNRAKLSWPEKMRIAEVLSRTLRSFRSLRVEQQPRDGEGRLSQL